MSKKKTLNCHKCPGKGTEQCLTCKRTNEDCSHRQYILDGYEPPQPDTSGSEQVTSLPDEVEDKMRKFLYDLFDLSYAELCLLKSIMNNLNLTEHGMEMEKLSRENMICSRFKTFQTRKRLLRKLGDEFASSLLTSGQKKPLKIELRK